MFLIYATLFGTAVNAVLATVVWMRFRQMRAAWFFIAVVVTRMVVASIDQIYLRHDPSISGAVAALSVSWVAASLMVLAQLLFVLSIYSPDWLTTRRAALITGAHLLAAAAIVYSILERSAPFVEAGRMPLTLREIYPAASLSALIALNVLAVIVVLGRTAARVRSERQPAVVVMGAVLVSASLGLLIVHFKDVGNAAILFDLSLTGALSYLLFQRRVFETTKVALDRALAGTRDGIAVLSAEGRVMYSNPAMSQYMYIVVSALARDEGSAGGEGLPPLLSRNHVQRYIDQDDRSLIVIASPITDERGDLQGHLVRVQDITESRRHEREISAQNRELAEALDVQKRLLSDLEEKKRAEEAASRAKAEAEAASAAKSMFLANMSHELRTPLNAILGFAQLMGRDRSLGAEARKSLSIIDKSGQHLLGLINNVLEISKIEAQKTSLVEAAFDLHRALGVIHEMFHDRAQEAGVAVVLQQTPDVPRFIRTDEGKLRQTLINLMGNAIKHTKKGQVMLRVEKVPPREGKSGSSKAVRLRFQVIDTGSGIEKSEQARLFQAFSTMARKGEPPDGTGLGLTISREFVRLMGGDIEVESEVGEGSTFSFEVDAKLAGAVEVKDKEEAGVVVGLAPGQQAYRVLVVDDQWENRDLLVQLLSAVGFDVRGASNGKEGIEIWKEWEPQLIWMDMRMPVMDGYEATRQIKGTLRGQATVVIAITASAFEKDRAVVLSSGCDDFVRKPFRDNDIFDKMAQHLGVRYVYSSAAAEEERSSSVVILEMSLRGVPADQREALRRAVTTLSAKATTAVIERIRETNAPVANALTELVRHYRFDQILALLDAG